MTSPCISAGLPMRSVRGPQAPGRSCRSRASRTAPANRSCCGPMGRYAWFIGGVATWFLGAGMQQVLFAWLLVGELHQDSQWVGAAQMCQTLPALLFLLLGGLIADPPHRRRVLVAPHAPAAVAAGGMGLAGGTGRPRLRG